RRLIARKFPSEIIGGVGQPGADIRDHFGSTVSGERKIAAQVRAGSAAAACGIKRPAQGAPLRTGGGTGGIIETIDPRRVVEAGVSAHAAAASTASGGSLSPILEQ